MTIMTIPVPQGKAPSALKHVAEVSSTYRVAADILYCGHPDAETQDMLRESGFDVTYAKTRETALAYLRSVGLRSRPMPAFMLVEYHPGAVDWWQPILNIRREDPVMREIPLLLLGTGTGGQTRFELAQEWGAVDVFDYPFFVPQLGQRLEYLVEENHYLQTDLESEVHSQEFQMPFLKRFFDIAIASFALLMLSPLLLLTALLIKLESKGPIFYVSPRVGTGYKVFPFMKFRSMRVNADKELENMKDLNQYAQPEDSSPDVALESVDIAEDPMKMADEAAWNHWMIADDATITEMDLREQREKDIEASFVKVKNDPRVTRIGHIIRNTSIDELPQLINVLRGDMSIVGNRPLPLYEAEKLTSDAWSLRFLAPAGITGWWQVTERGKSDVSQDSRKAKDVEYAEQYSLWMDFKIMFMTIPALLQKEDV